MSDDGHYYYIHADGSVEAMHDLTLAQARDKDYVTRINDIVWGQPMRLDGQRFQSNTFGTLVHAEIEKWNLDPSYVPPPEWEPYVIGWQQWYAQNIRYTVKAEYMCVDHATRTAGMIDFVGMTNDGNVVLCDYKNRSCTDKGKFYFKDCMQLAIESRVIKSEMGLTYLPFIYSMCIDTNTGRLFVKKWSDKMQQRAIQHFEALAHAYNVINGFGDTTNGLE